MNAIPFDTHRVVKRLTEAGFSEPQAETVTDVLREARDTELSSFATKLELAAEIGPLRTDMQADFAKLRSDMSADLAKSRGEMSAEFAKVRGEFEKLRAESARSQGEMLWWMIGLMLVQTGLIAGLIRLLARH